MTISTLDRLPPHSIEAEQGLLGSVLLDPIQAGDLRPELFYDLRHQKLALAMLAMADDSQPIDTVTLVTRLSGLGQLEEVGGAAYIAGLPNATPSAANWTYFQGMLHELYMLRRIIAHGAEFNSRAFERSGETQAILDDFERQALAIRDSMASDQDPNIREQMKEVLKEFEDCMEYQGRLRGLPTGFRDLDRMTSGFRECQMIVIAARPSVGKTSLAMNIAEHCAVDNQIPTAVFSLEMPAKSLLFRMTCCRARVGAKEAERGLLSEQDFPKITLASSEILKAPLYLIYRGGLTVGRLASQARRLKKRHGIKLLVIDHLQILLASDRRPESKVAEVTEISNSLKRLAMELEIPVLVLSQLSRENDKQARRPRLSDLRDSGAIEQDADVVAFLHRPNEADQNSDAEAIELLVDKHRDGPVGKIDLIFIKPYTRFESAANASPEGYAEPHND